MESGFNWKGREEALRALDETYDVVIVGGGINGCGVAYETARRGLSVLLLEKGDIGSGTSSRSSRLIHGGLRYLKHGHLKVVWDGSRERHWLRTHYPYLVRPIPFIIPFYEGEGEGPVMTILGLWLYDLLSGFTNVRKHRRLNRDEVLSLEPRIRESGLQGGAVYYDCLTDDFRLVLLNASLAAETGAQILTYCKAEAPLLEGGRVAGVRFVNLVEGGTYTARARVVVNTTGPWSDQVRSMVSPGEPMLRPTKGIHLIVPRGKIGNRNAVVVRSPRDDRVLFVLPWDDYTIVGTTDTDYSGDPDEVRAEREDADYLMEAVNRTFPHAEIRRSDLVSTFAALRPLIQDQGRTESEISRDYRIVEEAPGILSLLGGKLTTYRPSTTKLADVVFRILAKKARTGVRQSHPSRRQVTERHLNHLRIEAFRRARELGLDDEVVDHLLKSYGPSYTDLLELATESSLRDRIVPGAPYIMAEVVNSVEKEMAIKLEDVLVRRTKVFYEDPSHGMDIAEAVADMMAVLAGWSEERRSRELDDYRGIVHSMKAAMEDA